MKSIIIKESTFDLLFENLLTKLARDESKSKLEHRSVHYLIVDLKQKIKSEEF